jgi:hypothetical protein
MALCALLALAWLLIRKQVTVPPTGAYEMTVGTNLLRNTASLFLFFFNVPREALRFVLSEHSVAAGLWGAACLLLQALAFRLLVRGNGLGIGCKGKAALILFFLLSCAPYFLLSWNMYAYYITLGLAAWAMIGAFSLAGSRAKALAVAAALLSSGLAVAGNMALGYPALLARADWAERQLAIVERRLPNPPERLYVEIGNRHKYLGFGREGLAYRLGMDRDHIVELSDGDRVPEGATLLVVPAEGDVSIREGRASEPGPQLRRR